jgi:uncharacterized protein YndB with AHSA1/START domain
MHGDRHGGSIHWRLHLPSPIEQVFAALATDAGRRSFWAESAVEHDGYIDFEFSGGLQHRAKLLEVVAPTRFSLLYFGTVTTFLLQPSDRGGTELLLECHGASAADWSDFHAGWLNILFPLKAAVCYKVDLRNHDPARTWEQGYADQ